MLEGTEPNARSRDIFYFCPYCPSSWTSSVAFRRPFLQATRSPCSGQIFKGSWANFCISPRIAFCTSDKVLVTFPMGRSWEAVFVRTAGACWLFLLQAKVCKDRSCEGKFLEVNSKKAWKAAYRCWWKSSLECNVLDEQWTSNPNATGQEEHKSSRAL